MKLIIASGADSYGASGVSFNNKAVFAGGSHQFGPYGSDRKHCPTVALEV
jgi:hypothetical protein